MNYKRLYYVYILASKRNGTLYIGVTNNLYRRSFQHKQKEHPDGFTAKYNVNILVYFETFQYIQDALLREKRLKSWKRSWKIRLIEEQKSAWRDLFEDME